MSGINAGALDRELKRGSAELLILSVLLARPRHGYELSKLIRSSRSAGQLTEGQRALAEQCRTWEAFVPAVRLVRDEHA
jgi:hypothetical protein